MAFTIKPTKHDYILITVFLVITLPLSLPAILIGLQTHTPPDIGNRNLIYSTDGFDKALQEAFPQGTSEHDLVEILQNKNFNVLDEKNWADYEDSPGLPCNHRWQVIWETDWNNSISSIRGTYGTICL